MPSLDFYLNSLRTSGNTVGQAMAKHSNTVMEYTWDSDIQSKKCYIYDHFHDDKPHLAHDITHENTTKTPIDAKFIVYQYGSISKDQPSYHIMFKPSQPVKFSPSDDLYYFETDYKKRYNSNFPVGMFIDIPDEFGSYNKWLICVREHGNQFPKYAILPCDYYLNWIEVRGDERIKRKMWCAKRQQNSYNSGMWTDYYFTSQENQTKLFLPMNNLTEYFFYTHEKGLHNQRLIVSIPTERPIAWQVSKVETTHIFGLQCLTLAQDSFNPRTDYVNLETGEMFADYYSLATPVTPDNSTDKLPESISGDIKCNAGTIKCGGSYKKLTLLFNDANGNDITNDYIPFIKPENWKCFIDGVDITKDSNLVTWLSQAEPNKIKIKFANNRNYLMKILSVECSVVVNGTTITGKTDLQIIAL